MTLLPFHNYIPFHLYVFDLSMEKSTRRSKLNSSASLSSDHGGFKSFSLLSRCNSFSSCSNDSSFYSDGNRIQSRFRNSKAVVHQSPNGHKRSRNSSGSSISSNVSCISDKDLKSPAMISQTLNKTELNNCITNDATAPKLNYSKLNPRNEELKETVNDEFKETVNKELKETVIEELKETVNEELDHSKNSHVILPNTHNLRGRITKKGCACCPSSHATVVVRHYKNYITTEKNTSSITKSEGKTVISSTRVKTYVQQNSTDIPQTNEGINATSPNAMSKNKRRRSEIEKLYDSLHEIKWAKNFSPDNILRQINVRQAASCSAFGRSSVNTEDSPGKISKKQKLMCNVNNRKSSVKSKIGSECSEPSSCKTISSVKKETSTMTKCESEQKIADLQAITSDVCCCKQTYKSCTSDATINVSSCSMSCIVKEINVNPMESAHTEPPIIENGADYSDDAQLSYTSDESSSTMASAIVNLQSKHLLDFNYKSKNKKGSSETDVSEYSTPPTFFDIAEEGIRTIDACFREVGAEVVVSTCFEDGALPLLTSVREKTISNTVLEEPPTLEPCVTVEFDCNVKEALSEFFGNQIDFKNFTKLPQSNSSKTLKSKSFHSISNCQDSIENYAFSKWHYRRARRIIMKYIKQSWSKARSKHMGMPQKTEIVNSKIVKIPNGYKKHFCKNASSKVKEIKKLSDCQSSVLSLTSLKSDETFCDLSDKNKTDNTFHQIVSDKISPIKAKIGVSFNSAKSTSCLNDTRKVLKYSDETRKKIVLSEHSENQPQFVSFSKVEDDDDDDYKSHSEHVSRPPSSLGFFSQYKTITVNRTYNYTHIILLATGGRMFLTLQTLGEVRDAIIRANNDSSCPVLVITGVGNSYCLGLDLTPLVGPRKKIASTEIAIAVKELIEALSDFKKPLAAVVNGPALGLGMTLLNHADFTLASEKATFCMPHCFLGYMPEGGATLTLPQIVGSTVAMDLLLRGRTLTAREACNAGLISEVLEEERLPYELVSRVKDLAGSSLCALETTKALVKMQLNINLRIVLENEVKLLPRMWLTRTCQDSLRKALQSGILSE